MPGMDGFELLAAVRPARTLATTPFMLLTALDDRGNMRRGMTGGADDYLAKPFTRTELLDAVNAQLQSKLAALKEQLRARPRAGAPQGLPRDAENRTTVMRRPTPCAQTSPGRAESPLRRSQQLTDRSVG